ncbi:hypothetical protein [Anaeromyxobacter terrae]|uniref:hypothetical protein n=1 Tax=Anaeromyxobacter terrae TaxID=2925406 RepID=UPI001F57CA80|nr:hypothetical protein [Anaeromyxobacter sp. SG22]
MARRFRDDAPDDPEVTAQPSERLVRELATEADEKVVPLENVGGAAPTALGLDSGGNFPGPEDDLANLAEPEPPEAPEVEAMHVHEGADEEDEEER